MSAPAHDPRNPEVAPGVYRVTTAIVNCYLIGPPGAGDRGWVLVDTGLPGLQARVKAAAAARFSPGARPAAIVLSHGHFDHVGGLRQLAEDFDAPVYAHPLELPYLDGRAAYPPPDPSVGGGMMAYLSWTYPRGPVDLTGRLEALPVDGTVPGLPGWQWMHTPGHSPGHVSLFHPDDRTLVVGDAFVTTAQESLLALVTGRQEVHRPPAYLTTDWPAAWDSVSQLADLAPRVAASGHGLPMNGRALEEGLFGLAANFSRALPHVGRYLNEPVVSDQSGPRHVPEANLAGRVIPVASTLAFALGAAFLGRASRD